MLRVSRQIFMVENPNPVIAVYLRPASHLSVLRWQDWGFDQGSMYV